VDRDRAVSAQVMICSGQDATERQGRE
jgi:hypothetical protein